ncbi:Hint domain-containing protein [Thalassococcus sp. CAU 1522]|uniref:Hint domain-containing protein n=1 Tax=Thalassococcus arenae TaxID=2851652 RepID=A0ABS6NB28_9RHOB|nr:Hint domain-containing protein [Thalassococcus arenae]MBV2360735.1 Hint domain-containing protein [Thalassococcus arenae]
MSDPSPLRPTQSVQVYSGAMLRVANGANLGDGLSIADELMLDDIYRLSPLASARRLGLIVGAKPPFRVADDSETGTPGGALHLDCCVTFMSGDGETTEAIIVVETDDANDIGGIYLLPLAPMSSNVDYALVGIDTRAALQKFAQIACVSFTRGTLITLASGAQRPVEELKVGDLILTRDDGPQAIRWIGQNTVRAIGAFAPVLIKAGTLNNSRDLVVSPDHRLFIYQRRDRLGAGRAELLVRANHLVNGDSVTRRMGGFVDYFQMLFDHHQIIYAEGIAAESMLVDSRTSAALPDELTDQLDALLPDHRKSEPRDFEVRETLLNRPDAAALLKKSSSG